ncbi:MAG: dihydropteroate synthase [Acidimicrobiales bacterium]|nr:dihydropteroate synthase [Acidimicrobiales bacterium]
MGVVNVSPDSFSDGGLHFDVGDAVAHGLALARDGALVVDVGGESTRPGAADIPLDAELERVIPVIERLAAEGNVLISVDTRKAAVAAAAVAVGANIVNDVAGLRDPEMVAICAEMGVPVVIVHMQGSPTTMQLDPRYDDVVGEVVGWMEEQADVALAAGVPSVLLDPGLGFGKTLEHNLALLRALPLSQRFPVLIGASRKRTVEQLAGRASVQRRDPGSIAIHLWAAQRGAAMVRVHDVPGHREAMQVDRALRNASYTPG